ncbi:glutamate receptor ionotropic, delta-1-like, partial [Centruroides sculpturatus]|uniref:glutamate receptor ionotropic, delta-1-like n=1 Tax=Centruroides sculpturatus TaxID=218467 RepID=UPI000C6DFFF0
NVNDTYIWKLAAIKNPNYVTLDKFQNQMTGGRHFRVFKALHQKLKFRYTIVKPLDVFYGRLLENGTWTEMVGKLSRKEADMGITPFYVTLDRFFVLEYSTTIDFQHTVFIVKAPEIFTDWKSITAPFSFMLWIHIFLTVIMYGLILHKVLQRDFIAQDMEVYWSRNKIFWNLFCIFLYKGINLDSVKKFSSRFLIGIWCLSILVLVSSYSGTLMSFMTYPVSKQVPKTFEELANSVLRGEYSFGVNSKAALWLSIR